MLRHGLLYGIRILLGMAMVISFWLVGLVLFTRIIPSSPPDITSSTEGIVIFTGGKTRLHVALALFEQKKGRYLLISGVNPQSTLREKVASMPFRERISLGYEAHDTLGNAKETALWAQDHHIKTLRLITSNYHMPRSLLELRRLLPGVRIFPHPVVGNSFLKPKWWLEAPTLCLVVKEYNKFLFALISRPFKDFQEILTAREKA